MLSCVHVQTSAKGHGECRVAPGAIVKTGTNMLDAKKRVREGYHASGAPVVAWPGQQRITLHVGMKGLTGILVEETRTVVGTAKAGHDSDIPGNVLVEFSFEPVKVHFLGSQVDGDAINLRPGVLVERVGVVIRALVCIADLELVKRVVLVLCQRCRRTNQSNQEQEKDSGH